MKYFIYFVFLYSCFFSNSYGKVEHAYEIYSDFLKHHLTDNNSQQIVNEETKKRRKVTGAPCKGKKQCTQGNIYTYGEEFKLQKTITYGGEKEGGGSKIALLGSPTTVHFKQLFDGFYANHKNNSDRYVGFILAITLINGPRAEFVPKKGDSYYKDFERYKQGNIFNEIKYIFDEKEDGFLPYIVGTTFFRNLLKLVTDPYNLNLENPSADNQKYKTWLNEMSKVNIERLEKEELYEHLTKWLEATDGIAFQFLKQPARELFFWTKNKQRGIDYFLKGLPVSNHYVDLCRNYFMAMMKSFLIRDYRSLKHFMEEKHKIEWSFWEPEEYVKQYANLSYKDFIRPYNADRFEFGEKGYKGSYQDYQEISLLIPPYQSWVPLKGLPQQLIQGFTQSAHFQTHLRPDDWELNFKVFDNYADYWKSRLKFRSLLGLYDSNGKLSKLGPDLGHHWVVFPWKKNDQKILTGMPEVMRTIQYRIALRSIQGKTRIETSNWKSLHFIEPLKNLDSLMRKGPFKMVRTDPSYLDKELTFHPKAKMALPYSYILMNRQKFPSNSWAIEFRSGTKTDYTQLINMATVISYYKSEEFDQLQNIDDYILVDECLKNLSVEYIATAAVKLEKVMKECLKNPLVIPQELNGDINVDDFYDGYKKYLHKGSFRNIFSLQYFPYFWTWEAEGLKWISDHKKAELKKLRIYYIKQLYETLTNSYEEIEDPIPHVKRLVRELNAQFVRSSQVLHDLEKYIIPRPPTKLDSGATVTSNVKNNTYAQNLIYGLELSTRFIFKDVGLYIRTDAEQLKGYKYRTWMDYLFRYPTEFKVKDIEYLANTIGDQFHLEAQVEETGGTHGHSIAPEYVISFGNGPLDKMHVEYDGIVRNYLDEKKNIPIATSIRHGHIEASTPAVKDLDAIIDGFYKSTGIYGSNVNPSRVGGTHCNIDLSDLEDRKDTKTLSRWLALNLYLQPYLIYTFQRESRIRGAESIDYSKNDYESLLNWNGQYDDLIQFIIKDLHWYNSRRYRKTRYNFLDISTLFNRFVDPKMAIPDFNIFHPYHWYMPQFRLSKNKSRGEYRLFNAATDSIEAKLMLKLTKSIMNYAADHSKTLPSFDFNPIDFRTLYANPYDKTYYSDLIYKSKFPSFAATAKKIKNLYNGLKNNLNMLGLSDESRHYEYYLTENLINSILNLRKHSYTPFQDKIKFYSVKSKINFLETPLNEKIETKGDPNIYFERPDKVGNKVETMRQRRININTLELKEREWYQQEVRGLY